MSAFDYKRFKREVTDLLDHFDDGALDRAWEITCGLMETVAKVDRREDESLEDSRRSAWLDLYRCWNDEQATYTYWGMYEEMRHAVKERADELEWHIVDIGKSCLTTKAKNKKQRGKKQKEPTLRRTAHAHLSVVEG
jgi:hypothetical protein